MNGVFPSKNYTFCISRRTVSYSQIMRGKKWSGELRWAVVHMHKDVAKHTMSRYTGMGIQTIDRVISTFKRTGAVSLPSTKKQGRPHILSHGNVNVCPRVIDISFDCFELPLCLETWFADSTHI
jgi:hypothetical protein